MTNLFFNAGLSIFAISMLLVGCGGGAPTNTPASTLNFSGVVAVGALLPGAIVSGTCADGGGGSSAPAELDGSYSLTIRGALPCSFIANDAATQLKMRSLATTAGIVNITPLTEAIYQMSGGAVASLDSAKTNMNNLLVNMGITFSGDPITTPFTADGTGLDGHIKNFVAVATQSTSSGTINAVLGATQRQCNQNLTGGGTTTEKPTPCTPAEYAIPTLFGPDDKDLNDLSMSIIKKLDINVFFGAGGFISSLNFDNTIEAAIERGTKYGVAYIIKISAPAVRKMLGKNSSEYVANHISDIVINGAKIAGEKRTLEVGKLLVESILGGVFDYFEDDYSKYVVDVCSDENTQAGLCLGYSVRFGLFSYSANVGLQTAIDIAFNPQLFSNPKELQLTVLANEINELASWLVKDGTALVNIFKQTQLNNQSEYRANFARALQRQYNAYGDDIKNAELQWATYGMTNTAPANDYRVMWILDIANLNKKLPTTVGGEVALSGGLTPIVTKFGNQDQNIVNSKLPDDADTIKFMIDSQSKNILKLLNKWSAMEAKCMSLKIANGQVGISQCLNMMGISPAAPVTCPANKTLSSGVCVNASAILQINPIIFKNINNGTTSYSSGLVLYMPISTAYDNATVAGIGTENLTGGVAVLKTVAGQSSLQVVQSGGAASGDVLPIQAPMATNYIPKGANYTVKLYKGTTLVSTQSVTLADKLITPQEGAATSFPSIAFTTYADLCPNGVATTAQWYLIPNGLPNSPQNKLACTSSTATADVESGDVSGRRFDTILNVSKSVNTVAVDIPAASYLRGVNVALSTANEYGADTLMNAPPFASVSNAAEWAITIPATGGKYQLYSTYAADANRAVTISFNAGAVVFNNALGTTTGCWYPSCRQTVLVGTVQLSPGVNTMRVSRDSVFPHISGFSLVLVN
jgi:hypothetical protein